MQYRKLWIAFGLVNLISFTVLASVGYKAISNGPPIPSRVVTADRGCSSPAKHRVFALIEVVRRGG